MNGIIYLEDGTVYFGKGFGACGTTVGELVFNTAMIGYQEVLEDPSNAGLIVNMTYPWIGNYGIREGKDSKVHTKGLIAKYVNGNPSNHKSIKNLEEYMVEKGIVGVSGVDTRAITKKIRRSGTLKCVITNEELSVAELEKRVKEAEVKTDFVSECSVEAVEKIAGSELNLGILDLGDKDNIVKVLGQKGYNVTVFPYNSSIETIKAENIDGMIISGGPGSAESISEISNTVKEIAQSYPTFGIALGHQLLAKSFGAQVDKMSYGHRGGNHAVYDFGRERAYIVPQNHGYVVNKESLANTELEITHENLNDNTVEGLKHSSLKIQSIQFELEMESDLENTSYLLNDFIDTVKEGK